MKVFEAVKWDPDADNDEFQELFKKKKNKSVKHHIKKAKKKLEKVDATINKKMSNFIIKNNLQSSDTVNLMTPSTDEKLSRRKKNKREQHFINKDSKSQNSEQFHKNKKFEKSMSLNSTDLVCPPISSKNRKKNFKKLQKNVTNLINVDSLPDEKINLLKNPEIISKSKKKKFKNFQKDISETHVHSNDFLGTTSNDKFNKIKKKKLKKCNSRLDNENLISNEVVEQAESLTKIEKRRLKKLQKIQNRGVTTVSNTNIKSTKKHILLDDKINLDNAKNINDKKKRKKLKLKFDSTQTTVEKTSDGTKKINTSMEKYVKAETHQTQNELAQTQIVDKTPSSSLKAKKRQNFFGKLKVALEVAKNKKPMLNLRQKMMEKLKSARFRFINEQIYTTNSKEAQKIFQRDPETFRAYHDGYRKQVKSWPLNPLDVIINAIKKMPKTHIIADLGCGDAMLSKSVNQKVHSFDLVAADDSVVACDMSKLPLENNCVDVVVFCLSLMGTNLKDYLLEASRVLKVGGFLKIAEVESRFEKIEDFIKGVTHFGFKNTWKDQSNNLFYFLDFRKEKDIKHKNKLPTLSLLPCLYKKR